MQRLDHLLRSGLAVATGVETTPTSTHQTELQRHCMAVIDTLVCGRAELLRRVMQAPRPHPYDVLVEDKDFDTDVSAHVEAYLNEHLADVPASTKSVLFQFIPIGIQAQFTIISSFIEDAGYCVTPQQLETFREPSVRYCVLLSGYPAAIAQSTKMQVDLLGAAALDGLDISYDFAQHAYLDILLKLKMNPLQVQVVQRLDRCPAHEGIEQFGNVLFDVFAAVYTEAYDKYADETGTISEDRKRALIIEVRDRWLANGSRRIRRMYEEE